MEESLPITEAERLARLALTLTEGIGPSIGLRLIQTFGSAEAALSAQPSELTERGRLKPEVAASLKKSAGLAEKELKELKRLGGWLMVFGETAYPKALKEIYSPPLVLFGLGGLEPTDERAVAVVGSRQATDYGLRTTRRLAGQLAEMGISVVSGLAVGIDAAAHQGALEARGRTIGVLGCGLDVDYPREHRRLKEEVARQGAILSEYPLGTEPAPWRFPVRNRIIAGLAQGVVVAEASPRSGALITAKHALEAGRTVMAVPGPVTDLRRQGVHDLIRQGAVLVASGWQVAAELWPEAGPRLNGKKAAPVEASLAEVDEASRQLLELLAWEPKHIDEIIRKAALSPEEAQGRLFDLELKGLARRLPGQFFVRN